MRICIDIDGTICPLKSSSESYSDLKPFEGAAERIAQLKAQGHYIILNTARHMKTCDSNVGLVMARQGQMLMEWLAKHQFVYDELWLGKPYAHVYIDDRALTFKESWATVDEATLQKYNY